MKNWISKKFELLGPTESHCLKCEKPNRCCDFTPFIPNFLVGGLLKSGVPLEGLEGRLTPLGLFPDRKLNVCDFYLSDVGLCGIWKYRPSECASYFCSTFSNLDYFKNQSAWLFELELSMAQLALVEFGFSAQEVAEQVDAWNSWIEDRVGASGLVPWPNFLSQRLDERFKFYIKCSQWAEDLDLEEFKALLSPKMREGFDKHLVPSYVVPQ